MTLTSRGQGREALPVFFGLSYGVSLEPLEALERENGP
jgi:hypothetical protein